MAMNEKSLQNLKPFANGEDKRRNLNGARKPLTTALTTVIKGKKDIEIEGIDTVTGQKVKIKVPMPTKDVIVQALLRQAAKGNMIAIKEVWDRMEGRASQAIELKGEDGQEFKITLNLNQ